MKRRGRKRQADEGKWMCNGMKGVRRDKDEDDTMEKEDGEREREEGIECDIDLSGVISSVETENSLSFLHPDFEPRQDISLPWDFAGSRRR